jgi:prephenate dehydrogenase
VGDAPDQSPFLRIGIAGVGLIGGSIALAARRRWPSIAIVGVDRDDVLRLAADRRVIDEARPTVASLKDVDLIVLSTPIPAILDDVRTLGSVGTAAIVTDTGSTKRQIVDAAARAGLHRFVGGHPMAGAERGGLAHASASLFDDRPWLFVTGAGADADADAAIPQALSAFVRGLGARPHSTDATTHDRTMAYVSHLPQLVSTTLMTEVGQAVGEDGLAHAGRGLMDLTRLASSPGDIWQGIIATNADFIGEAIDALTSELGAARQAIGQSDDVARRFEAGRHWRDRWQPERSR